MALPPARAKGFRRRRRQASDHRLPMRCPVVWSIGGAFMSSGCVDRVPRDTLQPTYGLVGASWGNPKLLAGCPPELPGVEPGYLDTLRKHDDEHFTPTSVRVWNHLCSRLKEPGSLSHCLLGSLRQRRPWTDAWQRITVQMEVNNNICGSWVRATRASPPLKAAPLDGALHATSGRADRRGYSSTGERRRRVSSQP